MENRREILNQNEEAFKQKLKNRVIGFLGKLLNDAKMMKACTSNDKDGYFKTLMDEAKYLSEEEILSSPIHTMVEGFKIGQTWLGDGVIFKALKTVGSPRAGDIIDLNREICQNVRSKMKKTIKDNWLDMRVNLALSHGYTSSPVSFIDLSSTGVSSLRSDRILLDRKAWFNSHPSHALFEFKSMPELTEAEKQKAEEAYISALSQTPLKGSTSSDLQNLMNQDYNPNQPFIHLLNNRDLLNLTPQGRLNLNSRNMLIITREDRLNLTKVERHLRKKSSENYINIMQNYPIMAYATNDNPSDKDLEEIMSNIEEELEDLLKKIENKDTTLLFSFKPFVEGLLQEDKNHCLVAERIAQQIKKSENTNTAVAWGSGLIAAGACVVASFGVCAGFAVATGAYGVAHEHKRVSKGVGRYLSGKSFETFGELLTKNKIRSLAILGLGLGFIPSPVKVR